MSALARLLPRSQFRVAVPRVGFGAVIRTDSMPPLAPTLSANRRPGRARGRVRGLATRLTQGPVRLRQRPFLVAAAIAGVQLELGS